MMDLLNGGIVMDDSRVVTLFGQIDKMTELIEKQTDEPYLDSLTIALESIFYGEAQSLSNELLKAKINKALTDIDLSTYTIVERRKAVQLALLKGMKENVQQQHVLTPETVALFVGYLGNKLTQKKESITIFDPASGTGNLLLTVIEQLERKVQSFASEVDPTLIKLSVANANVQEKEVEFFHQDSLRPFLLDPVDLVVTDLPVGYYPDDVQASDFELKAHEGHSYAHHLFIEQSLKYTKESGYLIFLIPEFLFSSDQSEQLHKFIHKNAHIIGVIQLPETAFKSKKNMKSILILQKKGEETENIKQPLLAQLPSFTNTNAMEDILTKINAWFKQNMDL